MEQNTEEKILNDWNKQNGAPQFQHLRELYEWIKESMHYQGVQIISEDLKEESALIQNDDDFYVTLEKKKIRRRATRIGLKEITFRNRIKDFLKSKRLQK